MEVPVKVTFVGDHAVARMFTRYAKTRMFLLEREMGLYGLEQYSREDVPVEGVCVQSIKTFGHREVIITIAPSEEKKQRIIEEVVRYLIIARGTGLTVFEGVDEVQPFILAKAMSAPVGEYVYEFTPIANHVGRAGVHRFLQVRYVRGGKTASLCHYRDSPLGGGIDSIQCVIEVVGEAGVPSFIKRVGTSGLAEATLMASLSTTLDTLYVVHSIHYALTNTTDVYYEKYTPGIDGDGKAAWIQSGETNQLDFTTCGLYFVDTNIDRDGNICCFRSAEVDTTVDIYTSEGGLFFGFYPVIKETSPVSATMSRITGTRTNVSFFTYNVGDNEFIPSPRRLSQTVAPTAGQSWDYFHAEAGEYIKTSGVLNEGYGRGEAIKCSDFSTIANGSTSPYWRTTSGEFARWSIGDIEFETFSGNRREEDGASEWSNQCVSTGGGSGWREVTSTDKMGSASFNSIFSCIHIYKNFTQTDMRGELRESWPVGASGFYSGGDAYTWIGCPSMTLVPHETPPYLPINRRDMIHPFEIENIDAVHNAFISHDEETGLTFAGVRYDDAEHDQQWEIRVFPPGGQNGIDITQQVKDAFYGQLWHSFTFDGVEIPRTNEQKLIDFEASFECIYFKHVVARERKYVDD